MDLNFQMNYKNSKFNTNCAVEQTLQHLLIPFFLGHPVYVYAGLILSLALIALQPQPQLQCDGFDTIEINLVV